MIARKTWIDVRGMALAYLLVLELQLAPAILMYPEVQSIIPTVLKLIGGPFKHLTLDFRGYAALQIFFKGINVVGLAGAVLLGTILLARERENQTLEFLLARPISRSRLLFDKFWVVSLVLVVPIFLTSLTAVPLAATLGPGHELDYARLACACVHSSLFVMAFLALTTMLSAMLRTQVHVAFAAGCFIMVELGIFFVPQIRAWSVFRFSDFDVYGPLLAGTLSLPELFADKGVWLVAAIVALYVAADRALRRADV